MSSTSRLVVVACALSGLLACGPAPEVHHLQLDAPPPSRPAPSEQVPAGALEVTLLANEGFLLRGGGHAVLIDAFLAAPYAGADALPADTLARLCAAEPPFDAVDVALVSHEHADHVQAEPARAFLSASPDTLLVSSPQVIAVIEGGDAYAIPNADTHFPPLDYTTTHTHAGVQLEFFALSHGDDGPDAIQNMGHVITLGGLRVLHLGDGQAIPDNFRYQGFQQRPLDVALVPWWYFYERGGHEILRKMRSARVIIACHVAARERDAIASDLAETYPGVIVPEAPLQSWTVTLPNR